VAEAYEDLRPLLFSIAYRMLGSVAEAEDIVQEAFLRYQRALAEQTAEVESSRAYLSAVTTRPAIDHLRSARVRREQYMARSGSASAWQSAGRCSAPRCSHSAACGLRRPRWTAGSAASRRGSRPAARRPSQALSATRARDGAGARHEGALTAAALGPVVFAYDGSDLEDRYRRGRRASWRPDATRSSRPSGRRSAG
jgi:RNA polymerase sigma factor (sigma-70 family)